MCRDIHIQLKWGDDAPREDCEGTFMSMDDEWGPEAEIILDPEFEGALRFFIEQYFGGMVGTMTVHPAT